jgi:hypothetical protein
MERHIEKELLDALPPEDPRAIRSRLDLRRLNKWMGHARILAHALQHSFARHLSLRLVELGAGDGDFMLSVARRLRGEWRDVEALLMDRQDLVHANVRTRFADARWHVQSATADVFEWLRETPVKSEAVTANLFLHHFTEAQLCQMFLGIAAKAQVFVAIEPRRSAFALFFSRLVGLIGCNAVTRHDAVASVRAGFTGRELSELWPDPEHWELSERPAGLFSHVFIAQRKARTDSAALFQPVIEAVFQRPIPANREVPAEKPAAGVMHGELPRERGDQ